jgi:hypothetical protein
MSSSLRAIRLSLVVVFAFGCSERRAPEVQQAAAEPAAAPLLPAHAAASTSPSGLPAGHPPIESAPPDLPAGHPPIDASSTLAGGPRPVGEPLALAWTAPPSWRSQPPSSAMRRAQYRVPGAHGDGECLVFYFGPGQGGAPMENAERWARQFDEPSGQPASGSLKTRWEEVNGVKVLFAEMTGTYRSGSMAGEGEVVAKPGWALLGAVVEDVDGNWFFKFTGPEATVAAERASFETMLRSLQRRI